MKAIAVIVVLCLIAGLLVLPWLTRSLNRARHASRIKRPGYGGKVSGHLGDMDSGKANGSGAGKSERP